MIKNVVVTNQFGEQLTLELKSPEKSGFFVRKIEGLTPPKANINLSESLYLDGSYYNSARALQRNLLLDLGFYGAGSETIESIRRRSYKHFPVKKKITIEVETDTRTGYVEGYVESNEVNIFSPEESTVISVICPSAYFYGKDIIETEFSGITNGFEFPMENPSLVSSLITFGTVYINSSANLLYEGDVETGIVIYIAFMGGVNNLVIHNLSTSEDMAINSTKLIALTGSDFVLGDQLIISTIVGQKFAILIRAGIEINILNAIDFVADWFQVQRGDNVFTYTATSGVNNVRFYTEHQLVYEGM